MAEARVYGIMAPLLAFRMFESCRRHALSKGSWPDLSDVDEATDETRPSVRSVHTVGNVKGHAWHKTSVQPALCRGEGAGVKDRGTTTLHDTTARGSRDMWGLRL